MLTIFSLTLHEQLHFVVPYVIDYRLATEQQNCIIAQFFHAVPNIQRAEDLPELAARLQRGGTAACSTKNSYSRYVNIFAEKLLIMFHVFF